MIGLLEVGIQFTVFFFLANHWHVNLGASYEIVFLKLNYSDPYTTVGCVLYTPTDWCIRRTVAGLAFYVALLSFLNIDNISVCPGSLPVALHPVCCWLVCMYRYCSEGSFV